MILAEPKVRLHRVYFYQCDGLLDDVSAAAKIEIVHIIRQIVFRVIGLQYLHLLDHGADFILQQVPLRLS